MTELAIPNQQLEDLDEWYEEQLQPLVYTNSILTPAADGLDFVIDIERIDDGFRYAYPPYDRRLVDGVILHMLKSGGGGLILRSFLDEEDKVTGHPYKEISGWFVNPKGDSLATTIVRLPAEQIKAAHTTDASTGELLSLKSSVRFR